MDIIYIYRFGHTEGCDLDINKDYTCTIPFKGACSMYFASSLQPLTNKCTKLKSLFTFHF